MTYAVYSVAAAVPNLALALRKISYTPTARLRSAYHLVPRYAQECPKAEIPGLRPLGNGLLLERILMGGVVGEALPLANLKICLEQDQLLGQCIDAVV